MPTPAKSSPPISTVASEVFLEKVFPEELVYIKDRWAAAGSERVVSPADDGPASTKETVLPDPLPRPTVKNGLVGLAFSGGGIRSATFNLGLVQALQRRGILRHVDYLSTVSGGGFLVGSLTSLIRAPGSPFPFPQMDREGEPAALTYLRNHCNYLAPRGGIDYARFLGLLLRGILLNILILTPLIVITSVGIAEAYRHRLLDIIEKDPKASPWSWVEINWLTPWALAAATAWTLLFPLISYAYRVRYFRAQRRGDTKVQNSLGARDRYERTFGTCVILVVVAGALDFQPIFIHYFHRWYDHGRSVFTGLAGAASIAASLAAGRAVTLLKEHGKIVGLVLGGLLGPLLPFIGYLYLTDALVYGKLGNMMGVSPSWILLAGAVVTFLVLYVVVDINASSMHGFYRDRLARAYIIGGPHGADPRPEDDVSLSHICQEGSGAPYHLFNATLNLQGATQGIPPGRLSDYFVFTKHYLGSAHTGYCRTEHVVAAFPFVHLATAVAVSGAAAAPNMGAFTNRALVFLMAALNIRLGYWLPNPRRINAIAAGASDRAMAVLGRRLWRPGPTLLLREMLSLLDAQGDFVNVSDGGHLENSGIYELLRRRCRFIIAGDAEGDPEMAFHGLADLMRYARIDLGVEIEIRLDDFALDEHRFSRQHCALGRIRYPARGDDPPELGYLLYVKASLTRDEDGIVAEYRARSPEFPHESTADQFFDERQFEAYRALGFHAVDGLFEPYDARDEPRPISYADLVDWFHGVEVALAPHVEAVDAGGPLTAPWAQIEDLLKAPELAFYAREIYPELVQPDDPPPPPPGERMRLVLPIALQQLQLMERVFVALDLEQPKARDYAGNRGWLNLLRRWASAPSFRLAYVALASSHSSGFQHFCKYVLDLAIDYVWTPAEAEPAPPSLDVAAFAPVSLPGARWVLSARQAGSPGILVGEAVIGEKGAEPTIRLRPGFDSPDLRRGARWRLLKRLAPKGAVSPPTSSDDADDRVR